MNVEWVNVNVRMPEREGKYLVHCPCADPDRPLLTTAWYDPEEREWSLIHPAWLPAIRHWMLIPPPPGFQEN